MIWVQKSTTSAKQSEIATDILLEWASRQRRSMSHYADSAPSAEHKRKSPLRSSRSQAGE
ncbi:hypothetical protein CRV24_004527 [Beauveria bassiana]|nr:hypothetical protein CRV24_004527 [Beauveria bassiana]KAH8711161.1 hypothetical protein HC256_007977 [Beauveria bassiana]